MPTLWYCRYTGEAVLSSAKTYIMPFEFNIDLHCHPTGKPYMSGRSQQLHTPFESYENSINSKLLKALKKTIDKVAEIFLGTQSNFDNLQKGKVRVVFASITPMERGFLVMNPNPEKLLVDIGKDLITDRSTEIMGAATLSSSVVEALTGFAAQDLDFVKRHIRNYFREGLLPEYEYLLKYNNKSAEKGKYKIRLVKNFKEIEQTLAADNNTICVLLSVEGGHSFSSEVAKLGDLLERRFDKHDRNEDLLPLAEFEKNIAEMKRWEFVPFFVTLNHHFWNKLGGHARSLNKMVGTLVSQEEGINSRLQPLGEEVINRLLSKKNGPRVLIDMKHMGPRCRKDFYAFMDRVYWQKGDNVPILCSHTGIVSKVDTLNKLMKVDDTAELESKTNYLHECSINLCKEDILAIANSNGLIGIQLDEKRIAGKEVINAIKNSADEMTRRKLRMQYIKIICANLFEIAKAVDSKKAWDIPTIGSDYDGLINHLDFYPTTADMPAFRTDVLRFLKKPEEISQPGFDYVLTLEEINRLMFGLSAEEIAEKLFAANAMNFLKKNFVR